MVLIKEEIEVDSEDVIFLSETKATPRSDPDTDKTSDIKSSESRASLSSNISLTTGTGQLSIEDSSDTDILDNILANSAVRPLDLSSKSVDSSDNGSNSANLGNTNSNIQSANDGTNSDSSFMMLLTGAESLLQTSDGHGIEVKSDRLAVSPLKTGIKDVVNCVSDTNNVVQNSDNNSHVTLGTQVCDNSVSNTSSVSTDADWSAFNLSPSRRSTSANQQTDKNSSDGGDTSLGCIVDTCKNSDNSVIANTGHGLPSSSDATDQSIVSGSDNQSVFTSQLVAPGQALKNTNASVSLSNSSHVISNNPRSVSVVTQASSVDLSDPFQASHALLASLDMTLNCSTQSKNGSLNVTDQSISSSGNQSICSSQGALNVGQSANFTNGLLGGSVQCIQSSLNQSVSAVLNGDTSPTVNMFKRSVSVLDTSTPYYNSLTLPLSQQTKSYRRSVSSGSFATHKIVHASSVTDLSMQLPRSPSPQNPHHLPPKKQKRCYSDATRDFNCANCELNLTGQKSSRCPNGHSTCTKCLEERVKLVLTGRAKVGSCLYCCMNNYNRLFQVVSLTAFHVIKNWLIRTVLKISYY